MKEWMKNLWNQSGKWFLLGLPLATLLIGAAAWQANQAYEASKHTIADPPAESQVTFDLDKNRAYTSEDGVVVIGSSAAATVVSNYGAVNIAAQNGAEIFFDETAQTPYFNYRDSSGRRHQVWFEDARSIQAKMDLVREFGLAGVSFWHIGTYFAQGWEVLTANFLVNKLPSPR